MPFLFLDSSAIVKRYVVEAGTPWIRSLTAGGSGNTCCLSIVTAVEVVAALSRRQRVGSLTAAQADVLQKAFLADLQSRFRRWLLTEVLVKEALRLVVQHPLRAYDAVQLATALFLHTHRLTMGLSGVVFISADANLNAAAAAEGLSVDDPNKHP